MLKIVVPGGEQFNEDLQEFVNGKETTLTMEHSLVAIAKWESKWHKPFLNDGEKSAEELLDYIRCMTITQNVAPDTYFRLSKQNIEDIKVYMNDPMTATTFGSRPDDKTPKRQRVVTSELIYYWMISLNIPLEFQKWHINRLMTLIRVCNEENRAQDPKNKMSKSQLMKRNSSLNAARRKALHSKG